MFTRPKRPSHAIDLAPLIDVVFLLLIFFMLTSSFTPPSLPLDLPRATGTATPDAVAIAVSVDGAGNITVDGEPAPGTQFESRLAARLATNPALPVHFRGDRTIDYGVFIDLMDRARQVGAVKFHLVHDTRGAE